jgi:hypothetical protein
MLIKFTAVCEVDIDNALDPESTASIKDQLAEQFSEALADSADIDLRSLTVEIVEDDGENEEGPAQGQIEDAGV